MKRIKIFDENGGVSPEFEARAGDWIIRGLHITLFILVVYSLVMWAIYLFRAHM